MPRVKPLIRQDPKEAEVLSRVGGIMAAKHLTQDALAKKIGVSPATMSGRMKNIGSMRLSELWAIEKIGGE